MIRKRMKSRKDRNTRKIKLGKKNKSIQIENEQKKNEKDASKIHKERKTAYMAKAKVNGFKDDLSI